MGYSEYLIVGYGMCVTHLLDGDADDSRTINEKDIYDAEQFGIHIALSGDYTKYIDDVYFICEQSMYKINMDDMNNNDDSDDSDDDSPVVKIPTKKEIKNNAYKHIFEECCEYFGIDYDKEKNDIGIHKIRYRA